MELGQLLKMSQPSIGHGSERNRYGLSKVAASRQFSHPGWFFRLPNHTAAQFLKCVHCLPLPSCRLYLDGEPTARDRNDDHQQEQRANGELEPPTEHQGNDEPQKQEDDYNHHACQAKQHGITLSQPMKLLRQEKPSPDGHYSKQEPIWCEIEPAASGSGVHGLAPWSSTSVAQAGMGRQSAVRGATKGRCACRRTGDSRCSPRRRKPSWQHCGGRWSAACPLGKRVGRTKRPSDYT